VSIPRLRGRIWPYVLLEPRWAADRKQQLYGTCETSKRKSPYRRWHEKLPCGRWGDLISKPCRRADGAHLYDQSESIFSRQLIRIHWQRASTQRWERFAVREYECSLRPITTTHRRRYRNTKICTSQPLGRRAHYWRRVLTKAFPRTAETQNSKSTRATSISGAKG
jgi:hypothetical protein